MPRKTIIREYPEVVRGERGLTLRVLGQTYEPRPGTVSARALEDAALAAQVASVMEHGVQAPERECLDFEMYHDEGSAITLYVGDALEVANRSVSLAARVLVNDPRLSIDSVVLTRHGERTAEGVLYAGLEADLVDRLACVLNDLLDFVAKVVPEVAARTSERPADSILHAAQFARLVAVEGATKYPYDVEAGDVVDLGGGERLLVISRTTSPAGRSTTIEGTVGGEERRVRYSASAALDVLYLD